MSSKTLEPPSFISETKSYDTYEKDLKRWSLLTSVPKENQALMVLHFLDGDLSGIKDKIDEEIDEDVLHSEEGIKSLLEFFRKTYKRDSLADGFEKYMNFEKLKRNPNTTIQEFIPKFKAAYKKAVNIDCSLSNKVLAFKLLSASDL